MWSVVCEHVLVVAAVMWCVHMIDEFYNDYEIKIVLVVGVLQDFSSVHIGIYHTSIVHRLLTALQSSGLIARGPLPWLRRAAA